MAGVMFHCDKTGKIVSLKWIFDQDSVDWAELVELYKIAPLGIKEAGKLKIVFSNSLYKCFVYDGTRLVGVGRALADGADCSYICDVAVHPELQGAGLGKEIVSKLIELSNGYKKVLLYAVPGKEGFYKKLGFEKMLTAMAIFEDQDVARSVGLTDKT